MRYVLLLALAGCASSQWVKPGVSAEAFERDLYECQRDAAPSPSKRRYEDLVDRCLRVKGWNEK